MLENIRIKNLFIAVHVKFLDKARKTSCLEDNLSGRIASFEICQIYFYLFFLKFISIFIYSLCISQLMNSSFNYYTTFIYQGDGH